MPFTVRVKGADPLAMVLGERDVRVAGVGDCETVNGERRCGSSAACRVQHRHLSCAGGCNVGGWDGRGELRRADKRSWPRSPVPLHGIAGDEVRAVHRQGEGSRSARDGVGREGGEGGRSRRLRDGKRKRRCGSSATCRVQHRHLSCAGCCNVGGWDGCGELRGADKRSWPRSPVPLHGIAGDEVRAVHRQGEGSRSARDGVGREGREGGRSRRLRDGKR